MNKKWFWKQDMLEFPEKKKIQFQWNKILNVLCMFYISVWNEYCKVWFWKEKAINVKTSLNDAWRYKEKELYAVQTLSYLDEVWWEKK